jgi:HlyD family secretion protein
MKGRRLLLASVASVLLAGAAWQFTRPAASKADVPSAAVERRNLSATVMATGTIRPEVGAEVKVGSRVSGLLRKLHFNIGDEVRQGDLIAELDDRDLRAKVAQAEGDLVACVPESGHAGTRRHIQPSAHFQGTGGCRERDPRNPGRGSDRLLETG